MQRPAGVWQRNVTAGAALRPSSPSRPADPDDMETRCGVPMRRRARQAVKRALPIFGAIAFAYTAYTYVTLYRLGYAIRHGDSSVLETLVDWDGVREGLKEDVCDALAEGPEPAETATALPARDEAALPAFGSGF